MEVVNKNNMNLKRQSGSQSRRTEESVISGRVVEMKT